MPEWTNGTVLKTVEAQVSVGSNPTPSAHPDGRRPPLDTATAISYRLIQGCGDSIDFDCPEMGPPRRAAIGAATASRRLILLPTGQETVIRHFAPRAARTAERSVVDIAPL